MVSQKTDMTSGFLYVATGEKYLRETIKSAHSVKKWMPEIPILLCTDQSEVPENLFVQVRLIHSPTYSFFDKIVPLSESPFERTIFLDTDTVIVADISDLFEVLERFELAVSQANFRHDREFSAPNCFVEMNTGVIAYRSTESVKICSRAGSPSISITIGELVSSLVTNPFFARRYGIALLGFSSFLPSTIFDQKFRVSWGGAELESFMVVHTI